MTDWDLPAPHTLRIDVADADIDAYEHVNNAVYLEWFDRVAWAHSAALGLPIEACTTLRRGMAALRTEVDYERAAVRGDRVIAGTWIVDSDGRLRVTRRFQIRRAVDGVTLARATTQYVCLNLDTGRATRMPADFCRGYRPTGVAAT